MAGTPPQIRVLVVDDEPAILALLVQMLTRSRCTVTTAESANQAHTLLESGTAQFDCIITDAVMPGVSGYDFVTRLRKDPRFRELPVLMLTRKRHRKDVKLAVEAGVTDYVLKPIDEALLLEKLRSCVAGPKKVTA